MFFSRDTASWCRSSRAGSRSTRSEERRVGKWRDVRVTGVQTCALPISRERNGRLPVDGFHRHLSRAVSREPGNTKSHHSGQAVALPLPATDREPCFSPGTPHHGADPVELVPALRPQSADLCAEYFLGQAGRLPKGDTADLPWCGTGEFC